MNAAEIRGEREPSRGNRRSQRFPMPWRSASIEKMSTTLCRILPFEVASSMEGPPEGAATPTTTEQLGHGGEGCRDVQSRRKRYWQAYEESEREDPAEIFPEGMD